MLSNRQGGGADLKSAWINGRPDQCLRSAGPINFENDRPDHPVSSERPREAQVGILEQKMPPRPISEIDRSDRFFCGVQTWGRGATSFLEVGAADCDMRQGRGDRTLDYLKCWRGLSPPHPHERGVPPPPTGRPRGGLRKELRTGAISIREERRQILIPVLLKTVKIQILSFFSFGKFIICQS